MDKSEQLAENRRTLGAIHKISGMQHNSQPEPFPKRERSRRVCSTLDMTPPKQAQPLSCSLAAETWDAQHLDRLLQSSNKTEQLLLRSRAVSLLENNLTKKEQKNCSKYGYTNVFPLITLSQKSTIDLADPSVTGLHQSKISLNYSPLEESTMNPKERRLKLHKLRQEIDQYQKVHSMKLKQMRLKQILQSNYRHGLLGYENPESPSKVFSDDLQQQPTFHLQRRLRAANDYEKYKKSEIFGYQDISLPKEVGRLQDLPMRDSQKQPHHKRTFSHVKMFERPSHGYNILNNIQL